MISNIKKTKSVALLALLLFTGCGGNSDSATTDGRTNREWFVFVAEDTPKPVFMSVAQELENLVGSVAAPGDAVHVITAPKHNSVASVTIPAGERRTRLRDQQLRAELGKLKPILEASSAERSSQIQLPMVASTVRSLRSTNYPTKVILIGHPLYNDSRHAYWNMDNARVPSDGSLNSPLCPFNNGVDDFTKETELVWLAPSAEWGDDHAHRAAVVRFYRLFCQKNGATLAGFTTDPAAAFRVNHAQFDGSVTPEDDGVYMKVVSRESAPPPVPTEVQSFLAGIDEDHIGLAINWTSQDRHCDVDMWVSSSGHADELHFRKKKTAFGELFRDVTRSGSITADAQQYQNWGARIEHDRIRDVTLWLNTFQASKPVTVRIICVWRGIGRELIVEMPAGGDGADNKERREESPAWAKVKWSPAWRRL